VTEKEDQILVSSENVESITGIVKDQEPVLWVVKLDTGRNVKMVGEDLVRLAPKKFLQFVEENVIKNRTSSE